MNFVSILFVIQRRTLRAMERRKGSYLSLAPPPSQNILQQNEIIIFVRILFVVLTLYFKILAYIKSKPVLLKLYDCGLIMFLYTFQENFLSGSDSNMPFFHIPKKYQFLSCLHLPFILWFLISYRRECTKSSLRDKRWTFCGLQPKKGKRNLLFRHSQSVRHFRQLLNFTSCHKCRLPKWE